MSLWQEELNNQYEVRILKASIHSIGEVIINALSSAVYSTKCFVMFRTIYLVKKREVASKKLVIFFCDYSTKCFVLFLLANLKPYSQPRSRLRSFIV